MKQKRVAVIAGTFLDTEMGVKFFNLKGVSAEGYPVSTCPEEQSKLQILSPNELTFKIRSMIKEIKNKGFQKIIVYCNSLSAAVDMEKLSKEEDIEIITPLSVYKNIAKKYKNVGVFAANNKSLSGIERVIQNVNSNCNVIGIGILPVVIEIEKGIEPDKIVEKFMLKKIIEFYNFIKVDIIILGCTHFPYLYKELEKYASVPILDPAEMMYKMI